YYGTLTEEIQTSRTGTLRVEINNIDETSLPEVLKTPENDNRILAVAHNLSRSREVTLLTKDLPLRLKASVAGLAADEYNFDVIDIDWTGIVELDVAKETIDDLYELERLFIPKAVNHPVNTSFI